MLKHCHNSSIRLQRRCHGGLIINPDTVSLNSTVTVHSSCGSSESNTSDSLNSSFQIISDDQCYNVANNIGNIGGNIVGKLLLMKWQLCPF